MENTWYISGDLNIDVPLTALGPANIGGRLQIYVAPGAQIRVTNGAIFTQTLADIRGCNFLHDGILIEDGSIVMSESSINDATTAIEALGNGLISMGTSTIDNSYRGIFLNGQFGSGPKPSILTCLGNTFDRTGQMKPFAVGQNTSTQTYGINAVNAAPFALGLNAFRNITDGLLLENTDVFAIFNGFTNLNRGVRSAFSSYLGLGATSLLGRNFFTNVNDGATAFRVRTASIQNNSFTGGNRGIIHRNTLPNSLLNCDLNVMDARTQGIYGISNPSFNPLSTMSGNTILMNDATNPTGVGINFNTAAHQNLFVSGNTVNLRNAQTGINGRGLANMNIVDNTINLLNPTLLSADCIHLENPNGLGISCNLMDRVTGGAPVGDNKTRGLFSASGSNNHILCNNTSDLSRGMEFSDAAESELQGNSFANFFHGLEIGEMAWIGEQFTSINWGHGNRWVNTVELPPVLGEIGAVNLGDIDLTRFFVNPNPNVGQGNPEFLPTDQPSSWFQTNLEPALGCQPSCPPPAVPGFFNNSPSSLRDKIANGTINALAIPTAMKAKSSMQFYRTINQQPSLLSNSLYAAFKNAETNTTIGAFYEIEKGILNLASLSQTDAATIAQQTAILDSKLESVWAINQTSSPDIAQIKTLLAQASAASAQIKVIDNAQKAVMTTQIQMLKGQNAAISATETWEVNQKTVNDWTLTVLNGDELATILAPPVLAIAEQCPMEGGDAVYQARSLYVTTFDETAFFDDKVICAGVGDRSKKAAQSEFEGLLVYPNPTQDALFVEGSATKDADFTLTNSFGQIIKSGSLVNAVISTTDLAPGFYTLTVTHGSDRPKTAKVLIVR